MLRVIATTVSQYEPLGPTRRYAALQRLEAMGGRIAHLFERPAINRAGCFIVFDDLDRPGEEAAFGGVPDFEQALAMFAEWFRYGTEDFI